MGSNAFGKFKSVPVVPARQKMYAVEDLVGISREVCKRKSKDCWQLSFVMHIREQTDLVHRRRCQRHHYCLLEAHSVYCVRYLCYVNITKG